MKYWIKASFLEAGWAPVLILLFSLVVGKILRGYVIFPWLDKLVHVGGGMALSYFFCVSLFHLQKLLGSIRASKRLVLALALTIITAIGWEVMELLEDRFFHTQTNHGVADTLLDILFGLLGALFMVLVRADHTDVT